MDYAKIDRLWQSATLLIAPPLIVVLIWLRPGMDEYQWLLWLHLPLLMLHEAEEYVLAPMSSRSSSTSRHSPDRTRIRTIRWTTGTCSR